MPKIRIDPIAVLFLIVGFSLGFCAKTFNVYMEKNKEDIRKSPRQSIEVRIDPSQQEELFRAMQRFSSDRGFAIRIAPTGPNGLSYFIDMWRDDVHISAANSFEQGTFGVYFFDTDSTFYPSPEWALSILVSDFKNYLEEISNISITEK